MPSKGDFIQHDMTFASVPQTTEKPDGFISGIASSPTVDAYGHRVKTGAFDASIKKKGFGPNSLTPFVGDANIETPEYKAFLVDIEPIVGPVA